MHRLGCDPITGMCLIAMNQIECGTCRGKLHTKYALPAGEHTAECTRSPCSCQGIGTRICESCYGTGMEKISPDLRGRMFAELAKYKHPQFKQIEDRSSESPAERQTIEIVLVRPPKRINPPAPSVPVDASNADSSISQDSQDAHPGAASAWIDAPASGNHDDIVDAELADEL